MGITGYVVCPGKSIQKIIVDLQAKNGRNKRHDNSGTYKESKKKSGVFVG